MMPVTCRRATPGDIDAIVHLHNLAFPGFFLTFLGGSFLRLLYRAFVDVDGGICIVAQDGDGLRGVIVGAADPGSFFATLPGKRAGLFALRAMPGLLHNPLLVVCKCAWALFYRGERPAALPGAGLLSSVAVSPDMSGRGIGRKLVEAFCDELRRHNAGYVYLITDETDNELTNRFYRTCGFHLVDTFE